MEEERTQKESKGDQSKNELKIVLQAKD